MKGDDWGIFIGIIVAIGSVVGPWMWSVNSKLSRIARGTAITRRLLEELIEHRQRLELIERRLGQVSGDGRWPTRATRPREPETRPRPSDREPDTEDGSKPVVR